MSCKILIIDYGMGNLWSVISAFNFLGADCVVSGKPEQIKSADILILPGVGSYSRAMHTLMEKRLIESLRESVEIRQRKILGICLGFQMMANSGTEDGYTDGLGFIAKSVERFSPNELDGRKIPHIGFNQVTIPNNMKLFADFQDTADFYFIHSYRLLPDNLSGNFACCNHGIEFVAAYEKDNIFGTQFHPEKSQTNGLRLLKNFLNA